MNFFHVGESEGLPARPKLKNNVPDFLPDPILAGNQDIGQFFVQNFLLVAPLSPECNTMTC